MTETKKINRSILKILVEAAQERGCTVTEEDVLNPPSEAEMAEKSKRAREEALRQGLKILDDETSAELKRQAFELTR